VRLNDPHMLRFQSESMEESLNFRVDGNDSVEPSKDETANRSWTCTPSLLRGRVAPRMECEYGLAVRNRAAEVRESEESWCDVTADVQVHDIESQPDEEPEETEPMLRVIDSVTFGLPVPCDIDDLRGESFFLEILMNRHEIALNAAVGRRVGSQLHYKHFRTVIQRSLQDR
jgi:hypothetical protein